MPRQDVPYGGAICRLRERIAEIWDKLGEKLHTINGVPGDGDGNVKIVSGSSAVVISNDPTQNEIEVSLDTSQLPAASVSSVNGQTGAVALDAGDIPTVGGSGDVQADLQDLASDISSNTAAINAEALARQGADSALQTNINTVSASLPAAAAAAVAADPTVAQLATDVPNKLDKIASGSSLKAYTHTGATQGETSVVDGTTANSIGIRDANGRMQAADPASGATDKTLTTANWVSQTGSGSPNNLLHKNGNESKDGNLTLFKPLFISRPDNGACYVQIKDMGFDGATVPSGTITRQIYEAYDKDNHRILTYYMGRRTNGSNLLNMTIRNFDADGNQIGQGALILNSYADGTVDLRLQDGLGHDIQVAHT